MGRVSNKVAIITGAARGMGRTHALLLAKEGATVVLTDVNDVRGEATAAEIVATGGNAVYLHHDVASAADWKRVVAETIHRFEKIDVLVNNAGLLLMKTIDETTDEEWDRVLDVDAKGTFMGCKYVLPGMKLAGGGSIINVGSIYGMVGAPGSAAYVAAKGAVRFLTKAAAADYARFAIRVNSIHPGTIATEFIEDFLATEEGTQSLLGPTLLKRPAQPEEVSPAVLFLASDESSFMTGSEMIVDGGYTAV